MEKNIDVDMEDIDKRIKELEREKNEKKRQMQQLKQQTKNKKENKKHPGKEYIKKKIAAYEVIKWLRKAKLLAILAMVLPFLALILDLFVIFGSIAVILADCLLVGFILYKIERRRKQLIHRYGLKNNMKKKF